MIQSFRVAGLKYRSSNVVAAFSTGDVQRKIEIRQDPGNEHHSRLDGSVAQMVYVNDFHIGFVPAALCLWWERVKPSVLSASLVDGDNGPVVYLNFEADEFAPKG